ncbi:MAG: hypothetical protein RTU92_08580 [Candidatus Thorarchaeota archaeon]
MALVLGMNLNVDNEIWLNNLKVTIDKIMSPNESQITVHGAFMTEKKVINTSAFVPVTNQVKMMLGTDTNRDGFCRVLVEAPRSVKVDRGKKKHAEENAAL